MLLCGQLDGADDIKKAQDQLNKQLFDMDSNLQRIAAPNMKALEKYVSRFDLFVCGSFASAVLIAVGPLCCNSV